MRLLGCDKVLRDVYWTGQVLTWNLVLRLRLSGLPKTAPTAARPGGHCGTGFREGDTVNGCHPLAAAILS